MRLLFILALCVLSFTSEAVVTRHDVSSESYAVQSFPGYMIDMPHEGHGVLIHEQWIVTVAHTIFYDYVGKQFPIDDNLYEIKSVHIHPEYSQPDKKLFEGDLAPLMKHFKERSDIALVKLNKPVTGKTPIKIYTGDKEKGKTITVYGKGAMGNGLTGEDLDTKPLRKMNKFQNVVEHSESNWLIFKFDKPEHALPLEGMHGSGDSGGASVIFEEGVPYLVGLSSWQFAEGDISSFKGGLYGTKVYQVRVSSYYNWINKALNGANIQ